MTDLLLQLQNDLVDKLNSEDAFRYNIALSYRKEVIQDEIKRRLPHLTLKNGRKGCGMIVRMPIISGEDPNVDTPQSGVIAQIDVIEQPEINLLAHGAQLPAETVARAVRRTIHGFSIRQRMTLRHAPDAIQPILDLADYYPHCLGYRVSFLAEFSEDDYSKLPAPRASETPQKQIVLTMPPGSPPHVYDAAQIYFTTDGSFPGSGNAAAQLYAGPFTAAVGTTIVVAAYLPNFIGSDARCFTIK